jgi:hypothetical protein
MVLLALQLASSILELAPQAPGLVQRAGFAVVLGWYAAAALLLRGAGSGGGWGYGGQLDPHGDRVNHFLRTRGRPLKEKLTVEDAGG